MNTGKWCQRKALTLTAALLLGMMAPAMAAENTEALSLQQIVDTALKNNPTLLESQKRWEGKKASVAVATAWSNPTFGIMKDDANSLFSPGSAMMTEYSLTQEIMNPSKLKSMGKMATSDGLMAEANYQDKRMEVYSAAKQSYYDLLYASKALEIGKENQQLMGQLVQIAQVNYSTGMTSLQDTLKAQTEFSKMTTDLLDMAAMEAVTKAKLNTTMNRLADAPLTVKEEFSPSPHNFDLAGLKQQAAIGKPSVISMQRQVEMAQAGVEVAKKQKLPDFEVGVAYKDRKQTEMETQPDTWKISAMAMLPIWQGKNNGQIKTADANLDAVKASLINMQNMTSLDIQMALTEAQTAFRKIDLYQNTIIPESEVSYQAGIVGYTNNKVDFMAVLDSLNALRNAKLGAYKARIDYEKASTNVEKAVGKPLLNSGVQP